MNCPFGGNCINAAGCPGACVRGMEQAEAVARGAGKIDEAAIRADERAAVMNVVRRQIHTSHFLRVQAAVDADAKTRAEKQKAAA